MVGAEVAVEEVAVWVDLPTEGKEVSRPPFGNTCCDEMSVTPQPAEPPPGKPATKSTVILNCTFTSNLSLK